MRSSTMFWFLLRLFLTLYILLVGLLDTTVLVYAESERLAVSRGTTVPITGVVRFDFAVLIDHITERSSLPREDVQEIVFWYTVYGSYTHLNPLVLLAQAIHETAWFSSWWSQPPRRNLAGIGVNGRSYSHPPRCPSASDGTRWYCGWTYESWHDAVKHHVALVSVYSPWVVDGVYISSREILATHTSVRSRVILHTVADFDRIWSETPSASSIGRVVLQLYNVSHAEYVDCTVDAAVDNRQSVIIVDDDMLTSLICTAASLYRYIR